MGSLHRQGSLIAVLLLEMLTELIFRVRWGRQEQYRLLCFKTGQRESLNVCAPSGGFSGVVPPARVGEGGDHRAPLGADRSRWGGGSCQLPPHVSLPVRKEQQLVFGRQSPTTSHGT